MEGHYPGYECSDLTDTHHFSELITAQVQPLQLRELLHASVDTKNKQSVFIWNIRINIRINQKKNIYLSSKIYNMSVGRHLFLSCLKKPFHFHISTLMIG